MRSNTLIALRSFKLNLNKTLKPTLNLTDDFTEFSNHPIFLSP